MNTVRVEACDEKYAALKHHPSGIGLKKDANGAWRGLWPADQFTYRLIGEGSIREVVTPSGDIAGTLVDEAGQPLGPFPAADPLAVGEPLGLTEAERATLPPLGGIDPAAPPVLGQAGASGAKARTAEPRERQAAVPIPDDWKALSGNDKRSLAAQVSDQPIRTVLDAEAAIEAEVNRRRG